MGTESRVEAPALSRLLSTQASGFELFQAVRLLQRMLPGRSRVGWFHAPATEAVRFRSDTSLACPATRLRALSMPTANETIAPVQLTTAGLQLTGYLGVLPYFYTRLLAGSGHAYLDTFIHRLLSLQHRAWEKHRLNLSVESGSEEPGRRALGRGLALLGAAVSSGNGRAPSRLALQYANLRLGAPRSSIGLQQMLEDTCGVPVQIEQFRPKRIEIAADDRARLGGGGARRRLSDGVLGASMWHAGSSFRVVLGPMSNHDYQRFLPGSAPFRDLVALVGRFAGPSAGEFDVELRLCEADVVRAHVCFPTDRSVGEVFDPVPSIQTQLGRYGWLERPTRGGATARRGYRSAVFRGDTASDACGRLRAS